MVNSPLPQGKHALRSAEQAATLNFFVILVACIAAVAGILFGFDTGVISGAVLFIRHDFVLGKFAEGWVVSAVLWGALCGSALSGKFADAFGRRSLLIITALVFLVATAASAFSPDAQFLFMSRLVVGFAIGIASFTSPLYISEISPPRFRGALVSLNQLAITLGILAAYAVDAYFAPSENWRWMLGVGVVPAFILFLGMLFLPKSPRWIVLTGRIEAARQVLRSIRKRQNVEAELQDILNSVRERSSWKLLKQRWLRPAIVVALGLAFFQQCTGINTIIYYAPTIFELAGFKSAASAISVTAIVGTVNVVFTIIALPLIDLWGRRPLLLFGLTIMATSLIILGISFYVGAHSEALRWLSLFSMIGFIAGFAMSLGPIMWLVITEVFPLEIRGLGSSLAIAASWGFNGVVALTFVYLLSLLHPHGTFLLYGILSIIGWIFVYFVVPETKGVSLEHIESNLRAGSRARDLGQHSAG